MGYEFAHIVETKKPISSRIPQRTEPPVRESQLAQAIEETMKFYTGDLFVRLENLRSFWSANLEDLEHLSKQKWGELFDQVIVSEVEKRFFLWLANELRFEKNSVNAFSIGIARLGLPADTVTYEPLYHQVSKVYGTAFYTQSEALNLGTTNGLADFILTSHGTLTFDTGKLEAKGVAVSNIAKHIRQFFSDKVIPLHISAFVALHSLSVGRMTQVCSTTRIDQITASSFVPKKV